MNHSEVTSQKVYFENLDTIRFYAALMVFIQHAISNSFEYLPNGDSILNRLLKIISNGSLGVIIFFILSGFLITYLLIKEYQSQHKISLKKFYLKRILRIWPLYYAVTLFSFVIYPILKTALGYPNNSESNIFYHLTFLSNFDVINIQAYCPGNDTMIQNITWSVSIEEQFYLFWPLIFVLFRKKNWSILILILIIYSLCFRLYFSSNISIIYFHTLSILLYMALGGLTAYLCIYNSIVKTFFENSSTKTHLFLFTALLVLLFFNKELFSSEYGSTISTLSISLLLSAIIAAQSLTKRDSILNLGKMRFAKKNGKIHLRYLFITSNSDFDC
jgi:peptidoglycan/LPS O-acetylase OafA/YrhL